MVLPTDDQAERTATMAGALADRFGIGAIKIAERQLVGATEDVARAWNAIIALL